MNEGRKNQDSAPIAETELQAVGLSPRGDVQVYHAGARSIRCESWSARNCIGTGKISIAHPR